MYKRQVLDYALEAVVRQGIDPLQKAIRGGTDGSRLSFMGLSLIHISEPTRPY